MPVAGRSAGSQSGGLSLSSENGPIYIAGIVLICVLALAVALWLGIRTYRKRSRAEREDVRNGAFLSVKGLVREDEIGENEKHSELPDYLPTMQGKGFSREKLTASVILPDKAILRQNASRDEIISYHASNGTMPRPFTAKPFTFALDAGQNPRHSGKSWRSSLLPSPENLFPRQSFMSGNSRFSVVSSTSSMESAGGASRRVRQLFTPVLPDELLVSTLGERLTVIQSFDDGWTLVGRDNGGLAPMAKSLFKAPSPSDDVELGVVPAWCFIKPCKGLRAERPVRTSSLGITVQMDAPGPAAASRDDVMSWSNF